MRIEVLYVPGCPNYEPAIERLQAVLESQSLQAEILRADNQRGSSQSSVLPRFSNHSYRRG